MSQSTSGRIDGIEGRVARLERELALLRLQIRNLDWRLGGQDAAEAPPPVPGGPAEAEPGSASSPPPPASLEAPEAAEAAETWTPPRPADTRPALDAVFAPAESRFEPATFARTRAAPRDLSEAPSLERRIGGQIFAVAGALIVVVGLALLVKVAIDYGWFRFLPPGLRCVGIALAGVGFLGAGEFLRTRVRAIAVAGCNAAGIGALYIAAYAAFGVFHLIAPAPAFVLMASAAGVGLAVALRHGFLSTAVLSLVGAYLVPVLLSNAETSPYVMPVYLLLLSTVALTLAAGRPRPFSQVRDVAWVGAGLLGLGWTLAEAREHAWLVVAFWGLAWLLHQAELLYSAARGQLRPTALAESHTRRFRVFSRRRLEPVLLAIATTAAVVGITTVVLDSRLGLPRWLAPAGAFGATSLLALTLGGHLRVLRDKPRTDLEVLAAAHAAQAGALLITTVALALSGWVEATAWLAMGVAAVVAGRWIGSRALDLYGLVLLGIASVRIGTYDLLIGPAGVPWSTDSPIALAPWTLLVLAGAVAWAIVAALMLRTMHDDDGVIVVGPRPRIALGATGLAWLALLAAPAHPESAAVAVCIAWLGLSLTLRGAARALPRFSLNAFASVTAALTLLPWLVSCDPADWLTSTTPIGMHRGFLLGGAITLTLLAHAWDARRRPEAQGWPDASIALLTLAGLVAFATTSIEISRAAGMLAHDPTARRAAVSIWWGLWGVLLVIGGFVRRVAPPRYAGLALISIAAFKAVLLDLSGVPPLWRVASFVGLGVLMLGVAVLYGRVSAALSSERSPDPD